MFYFQLYVHFFVSDFMLGMTYSAKTDAFLQLTLAKIDLRYSIEQRCGVVGDTHHRLTPALVV